MRLAVGCADYDYLSLPGLRDAPEDGGRRMRLRQSLCLGVMGEYDSMSIRELGEDPGVSCRGQILTRLQAMA